MTVMNWMHKCSARKQSWSLLACLKFIHSHQPAVWQDYLHPPLRQTWILWPPTSGNQAIINANGPVRNPLASSRSGDKSWTHPHGSLRHEYSEENIVNHTTEMILWSMTLPCSSVLAEFMTVGRASPVGQIWGFPQVSISGERNTKRSAPLNDALIFTEK